MFTRRRLLAFFGLLVIAFAVFASSLVEPPARLNVDHFISIKNGMTLADVETLLGGPPGDYGQNRGGFQCATAEGILWPPNSVEQIWYDDTHHFEIAFDQEGRVVGFHQRVGYNRSPPDNFLFRARMFVLTHLGI
jgi:hypothetical protein